MHPESGNVHEAAQTASRERWRICASGGLLAAAAALPCTPSGESPARWCLDAFQDGVIQGAWALCSVGLPFIFGGSVAALAAVERWWGAEPSPRYLRLVLLVMHAQLLLFAAAWSRAPGLIAALPLLGFAVVSFLSFGWRSMSARMRWAGHHATHLRWLVRWGAAILAPCFAWARLQTLGAFPFGPCVDLGLVASLMLLFASRRPAIPATRDGDV